MRFVTKSITEICRCIEEEVSRVTQVNKIVMKFSGELLDGLSIAGVGNPDHHWFITTVRISIEIANSVCSAHEKMQTLWDRVARTNPVGAEKFAPLNKSILGKHR